MAATLSPVNFRIPLMKAMGVKTGFQVGVAVPFEDTHVSIMTEMGISDANQYGMAAGVNVTQVSRWIMFAFQSLRDRDLMTSSKRGCWELTPRGLTVAKGLCDGSLTAIPADPLAADEPTETAPLDLPAETSMTETVAEVEAPKVIDNSTNGATLPIGPGNPTEGYSEDPYIRGLAIEQTPCFGAYSNRSPLCNVCPIKSGCTNAAAAMLSLLSSGLKDQDAREEAAALAAAKNAAARAAAGKSPLPAGTVTSVLDEMAGSSTMPPAKKLDTSKAQECRAVTKCLCARCSKDIAKDEVCYWIPPSSSDSETGMLHKGCL